MADVVPVFENETPVTVYHCNGHSACVQEKYYWGTDLSGTAQGAGGVGGLLFTATASGEVFAPAYDGNGNVMALAEVDAAVPAVVARYEYDAFGNVVRSEGPQTEANVFGFSTKYRDGESGLLYYGHRYYDARNGRWPSRDPIGEWGGLNLYAFITNSGIDEIDLLGKRRVPGTVNYVPVVRALNAHRAKDNEVLAAYGFLGDRAFRLAVFEPVSPSRLEPVRPGTHSYAEFTYLIAARNGQMQAKKWRLNIDEELKDVLTSLVDVFLFRTSYRSYLDHLTTSRNWMLITRGDFQGATTAPRRDTTLGIFTLCL